MHPPQRLYRFRSLSADTFKREIQALQSSYLYAPPFKSMNDPMEAFYETGGPRDRIVDAMLGAKGDLTKEMYKLLDDAVANFALISFTGTYEALPLWAYYANNFTGMCLEFDPQRLPIGDLQGEQLRPVIYARDALPPIGIHDLVPDSTGEAIVARITRKREEWAHEREWRYVTGSVGPKHYVDDALTRIFLGPRIQPEHAARICQIMQRRPVEVLQGWVRGFELEFETIQQATSLAECDRVGAGTFSPAGALYSEDELKAFLGDRYAMLVAECEAIAAHPNIEEVINADISTKNKAVVYLNVTSKLRNGRIVYHKRHFDRHMNPVADPLEG